MITNLLKITYQKINNIGKYSIINDKWSFSYTVTFLTTYNNSTYPTIYFKRYRLNDMPISK